MNIRRRNEENNSKKKRNNAFSTYSQRNSKFIPLCCLIRSDRPIYEKWHTVWHIASGLAPFSSICYVEYMRRLGIIDPYQPYMPTIGFIISLGLNILGSSMGVFPVD